MNSKYLAIVTVVGYPLFIFLLMLHIVGNSRADHGWVVVGVFFVFIFSIFFAVLASLQLLVRSKNLGEKGLLIKYSNKLLGSALLIYLFFILKVKEIFGSESLFYATLSLPVISLVVLFTMSISKSDKEVYNHISLALYAIYLLFPFIVYFYF